jgi:hypothetical protein
VTAACRQMCSRMEVEARKPFVLMSHRTVMRAFPVCIEGTGTGAESPNQPTTHNPQNTAPSRMRLEIAILSKLGLPARQFQEAPIPCSTRSRHPMLTQCSLSASTERTYSTSPYAVSNSWVCTSRSNLT